MRHSSPPSVARQHPETVLPRIVNDVVDVTDGSPVERVHYVPRGSSVEGTVDVNFVARSIVEILSPKYRTSRGGSHMQRASSAHDLVGNAKFAPIRVQRDDCTGHSADESIRQNRQRMKAVAQESCAQSV